MSVLLFILIMFGMWFYFVQGIYLPTYRYFQRIKINKLRDELEQLYLEKKVSNEVAGIADNIISQGLRFLPSFTFVELIAMDIRVNKDSSLVNEAELKVKQIKDSNNRELEGILSRTASILFHVSITNMIGWLPILIPILIPLMLFIFLFQGIGKIKAYFKKKSEMIAVLDDKSLSHLYIR